MAKLHDTTGTEAVDDGYDLTPLARQRFGILAHLPATGDRRLSATAIGTYASIVARSYLVVDLDEPDIDPVERLAWTDGIHELIAAGYASQDIIQPRVYYLTLMPQHAPFPPVDNGNPVTG